MAAVFHLSSQNFRTYFPLLARAKFYTRLSLKLSYSVGACPNASGVRQVILTWVSVCVTVAYRHCCTPCSGGFAVQLSCWLCAEACRSRPCATTWTVRFITSFSADKRGRYMSTVCMLSVRVKNSHRSYTQHSHSIRGSFLAHFLN